MTDNDNSIHPDPDDLERLVLRSPTLSEGATRLIRLHLEVCPPCADEKNRLVRFYAELAKTDHSAFSHRAAAFLSTLPDRKTAALAQIIELFPSPRTTRIQAAKPNVIVLAAQDAPGSRRYVPVVTMTSADQETMLYVQRDTKKNRFLLQVLSENPEILDHALLTFPPTSIALVTDASGECITPEDSLPSIKDLHALVRPASERFDCSSFQIADQQQGAAIIFLGDKGGSLDVIVDALKVTLSYHASGQETTPATRMCLDTETETMTLELEENCASIGRNRLSQLSRAFMYA